MAFLDIFKRLFLPAIIAVFIYVLLVYLLLPLYRNHHQRYADYLPLHNLNLSERTSGFRARVRRMFLPAYMHWRQDISNGVHRRGSEGSEDDELFGVEEGESMVGFDVVGRRERRIRREEGVGGEIDSQRRLSRELEEGFKDESEDEDGRGDDRRR